MGAIICKSCKAPHSMDDINHYRWAGIRHCYNPDTKALICPECLETMRAAFISDPGAFAAWKAEQGFPR